MADWVKISKDKYAKNTVIDNKSHIFTLTLQSIGVYSGGLSWVLKGYLLKEDEILASYWIRDDGYNNALKSSEENKLWLEPAILINANKIVGKVTKLFLK